MSVVDHVHEIKVLVNKLYNLNIKIPESFQVGGAIKAKLPPSWNDYRKKFLHMTRSC